MATLRQKDFFLSPTPPAGWRGDYTGVYPGATPMLTWDTEKGTNVRCAKLDAVALPGRPTGGNHTALPMHAFRITLSGDVITKQELGQATQVCNARSPRCFDGLKTPSVDSNRVYVTGISRGGFGVWDIVQRRPDLFAAAVPICGGGDTNQVAQLAQMPIWAFRGAVDTIVKPKRSRDMVAALERAGGKPKYTEYKGQNHWVWDMTYQDRNVLDWLFAQKKNDGRGGP